METAKISCHVDALKMVVNGSTNSTAFKWLPAKMAKRKGALGPNICGEWMWSMNLYHFYQRHWRSVAWSQQKYWTQYDLYPFSIHTLVERLLVPKALYPIYPTCFVKKSPRNCLPIAILVRNLLGCQRFHETSLIAGHHQKTRPRRWWRAEVWGILRR